MLVYSDWFTRNLDNVYQYSYTIVSSQNSIHVGKLPVRMGQHAAFRARHTNVGVHSSTTVGNAKVDFPYN